MLINEVPNTGVVRERFAEREIVFRADPWLASLFHGWGTVRREGDENTPLFVLSLDWPRPFSKHAEMVDHILKSINSLPSSGDNSEMEELLGNRPEKEGGFKLGAMHTWGVLPVVYFWGEPMDVVNLSYFGEVRPQRYNRYNRNKFILTVYESFVWSEVQDWLMRYEKLREKGHPYPEPQEEKTFKKGVVHQYQRVIYFWSTGEWISYLSAFGSITLVRAPDAGFFASVNMSKGVRYYKILVPQSVSFDQVLSIMEELEDVAA